MFDQLVASTTGARGAGAVDAWSRVEAAACARRLAAMLTMLDTAYAADGSADRDQWCIDNWSAVCAHIGATTRLTTGAASNLLLIAVALRDRFPKVDALFAAGLIDYRMVRTIVHRARLVQDPATLRTLDKALAKALRTWAPMSQDKTEKTIDALVERLDPDAVHRTHTRAQGRGVQLTYDEGSGMAELFGTLFAHDAAALDTRLNAFADTVCPADPRTKDQRRADALGALAHGADRLACLCESPDCPAATNPPTTGVIIHLIAHHDTLTDPPRPGPEAPSDDDGGDGDGDGGPNTPDTGDRGISDRGEGADGGTDGTDGTDGGPDRPDRTQPDDHESDHEPTEPERGSEYEVQDVEAPAPATDCVTHGEPATDSTLTDDQTNTDDPDADNDASYAADCRPAATAYNPNTDPTRAERIAEECAGLDGVPPPMFTRPLRDMTLAELYAASTNPPGQPSTVRPAALMGGRVLPGAIARRAARNAKIEVIVHPGQAPPEPRHRPSKKLADFVRCRDQTCRYPGCRVPATHCDLDHTIPWPQGPTQAANLKTLCRHHHLLKTFWVGNGGWKDRQLPNGDVTWNTPDGRQHTTHPGSRLLFPELCEPTAPVHATEIPPSHTTAAATGLTMPRRKTTRARDRAHRITHERELNRATTLSDATQARAAKKAARTSNRTGPEESPPF